MDENTQPPVISPIPQVNHLRRNAIIWLIIGGVVLSALTAAAIFFYSLSTRPARLTVRKPRVSSPSLVPTKGAQGIQRYENPTQKISFDYPADWVVTDTNSRYQTKTCEPSAEDSFGDCDLSGQTPTGAYTYGQVLTIRPQSSFKEAYYPNPAIQLLYYNNPENLSIQEFNARYLSRPVAGDPVSIWAEGYQTITNANGVTAYYDAAHYCVDVCQVYVFSGKGKIFVLKNFPTNAPIQLDVFKTIFFSLRLMQN